MARSSEENREVALLNLQVHTLYQVNRFISSIYNLDQLLDLIMREAETAVSGEASCIALHDPLDNLLHIEFASGEADEGVRHLTLAMGQGILGEVAVSGKAIRVDDARRDPRFDSFVDRQTGFTTKSILATPMRRREEVLGVLEVINKKDGSCFTEEDSLLLEVVANQAAVAIENAKLFERMVQSEQLSVIGRMAASIIHDLKQPMAVIRGFAELLGNPDVDPEKRKAFSHMILEDVDLFLSMTQELLDYSRGSMSLEPREIQVGEWIEDVLRPLREDLAGSEVKVMTQLDYRGTAWLDPDKMRRVVNNIVGNAQDAMPDGGILTVATHRDGDSWVLELRDTGTGIPQELRARMFEPFVTSGKDRGTGLGLAIVREIVTGHSGTISVHSRIAGEEEGQEPGTVFSITMPTSNSQISQRPARP